MALTADAAAPARVPMSRIYLFALIELAALGALVTPLVVSLSMKVMQIVPDTDKEAVLGLVTAVGAISAMLSNPIFGHLSDRTRSRFGRRRPWIVGGVVAGALAAVLLAIADSVPMLVLAWVLSQAAYNATLASLSSLLADQVPEAQRAKASGIFGAFGFAGMVPAMIVAALFASNLPVVILFMPLLAIVIVAIVCAVIPDPQVTNPAVGGVKISQVFTAFAFNPFAVREFSLTWVQRAVMQFGYVIVSTFGVYYLMLRLALEADAAASLTSIATLAGAALNFIAAFAFGYLASRRGNYTWFIAGSALVMAASLLMKAFTQDLTVFWISTALAGFALGAYYAVDLALVMRTLPAGNEGKFLGIFNMAKTLPQSVGPALAPAIVLIGGTDPLAGGDKNYAALYIVATVIVLLSLLTLPGLKNVLRRDRYEAQVAARTSAGVTIAPAGSEQNTVTENA